MNILQSILNLFRRPLEPEGVEVVEHDTVMQIQPTGEMIEVTEDDT